MSEEEIAGWLVRQLGRELKLDPGRIDPDAHFTALGLDSVTAVTIAGDLEDWLGRRLPDSLLWDHPSVRALAGFLAGGAERPSRG